MSLKIFLFALLIATPALASLEDQHLGFRNENRIIGAVNKLVDSAKSIIADALEEHREKFLDLLQDIEKVILIYEREILQNAETIINEIKQKLELAKQIGKDASECILQQKEKIEKLNEVTIAELKKCTNDVVAELTQLFNDLVISLNEINDRILALLDEFYACTNSSCKLNVGKKIAEEVLNVNGVMGDSITEFLSIIRENRESVKACVSSNMKSFKLELENIVQELEECLQQ